jgi:hypothetical protein
MLVLTHCLCSCSPTDRAHPLLVLTHCLCPSPVHARHCSYSPLAHAPALLVLTPCPCPTPVHAHPLLMPSSSLCPPPAPARPARPLCAHQLLVFAHCPCPPPARARHCLCQSLMLQVATIDYDKYSLAPEEYLCTACPPGYEAGFLEFFLQAFLFN